MKYTIKHITGIAALLSALIIQPGCAKSYTDPNRADEAQTLSSPQGLTGLVVGLQRVYTLGRGSTLYNRITVNGLTTNELIVVNTGNTGEVQLAAGGNTVDGNNSILTTFWTTCNKVVYDADRAITNAKLLSDKNYASGIIAYASIFKALSIGDMSEFWEKIPAGTGLNVTFIDRIDGYKQAITVIDNALTVITANAISASFIFNIPAGIDISNTLNALKARYSLAAGLYPQALAAANLVSLTTKSTFNFDALSLNPVYETSTATNNVVQVKDSTLGLQPVAFEPSLTDGRVPFYTVRNLTIAPRFRINGFFNAAAIAIPVYLPGEMTLIKAECYARQSIPDLVNGYLELNKVVTKNNDIYGVNANQPPLVPGTVAQLLDQIYRNRCIELYMSGLKLEDMRRFARPNAERKRNLMPYPLRERDNNPNTPPDPVF
jgi:starch-binding outer membrane protein, SusD/RagB family